MGTERLADIFADNELQRKVKVWTKGRVIPGHDAGLWREDAFGNVIHWDEYGQNSAFGWHLDHYPIPKSQGGPDTVDNLRPLHWRANTLLGGLLSGN